MSQINAAGMHFGTGRGPRLGDPAQEKEIADAAKNALKDVKQAIKDAPKHGGGYGGDGDITNVNR